MAIIIHITHTLLVIQTRSSDCPQSSDTALPPEDIINTTLLPLQSRKRLQSASVYNNKYSTLRFMQESYLQRPPAIAVHLHREILRVPRADLPKDWVDINISPGGALVRRVLHVLATESGAPPLPDHRTPLERRPTMPAESLWKVHFLVHTWITGS